MTNATFEKLKKDGRKVTMEWLAVTGKLVESNADTNENDTEAKLNELKALGILVS